MDYEALAKEAESRGMTLWPGTDKVKEWRTGFLAPEGYRGLTSSSPETAPRYISLAEQASRKARFEGDYYKSAVVSFGSFERFVKRYNK